MSITRNCMYATDKSSQFGTCHRPVKISYPPRHRPRDEAKYPSCTSNHDDCCSASCALFTMVRHVAPCPSIPAIPAPDSMVLGVAGALAGRQEWTAHTTIR